MKVAILSGSVYGTAEEVARHAQQLLQAAGLEPALALRDEPFGQRHAIYCGPDGVLIDIITPIPPSPEFLAQYAPGTAP